MSDSPSLADALQRARKAARLTQREAAARACVHFVSISRWENGAPIGADDLGHLARAYGTTVGALLGEHSTPANDSNPAKEPAAPRSADYWQGRQDALLDMLVFASTLQRQAAEWQGKAIEAQRELIANTRPVPVEPPPSVPVRAHEQPASGPPTTAEKAAAKQAKKAPARRKRGGG